jgi:hypothetical protein
MTRDTQGQGSLNEGEGSVQLTSCLDQLLFILQYTFVTKQATMRRRSTVLSLPPRLVFPDKDKCMGKGEGAGVMHSVIL